MNRQFERAEAHLRQATSLNTNDGHAAAPLSDLYSHVGRAVEAVEWADKAIRLIPYHPDWYIAFRAEAFYFAFRYSEGADAVTRMTSGEYWGRAIAAACCAMAAISDEAQTHAAE